MISIHSHDPISSPLCKQKLSRDVVKVSQSLHHLFSRNPKCRNILLCYTKKEARWEVVAYDIMLGKESRQPRLREHILL
jgi:hypothetical protein